MKNYEVVFLLGFEVALDSSTRSGFGLALADAKGRGYMLGDVRMEAAVALSEARRAEKIVILGMKQLTEGALDSAVGIAEMLVHDYGVDPKQVEAYPEDTKTTRGNLEAIRKSFNEGGFKKGEACVLTNLHHCPRTQAFIRDLGLEDLDLEVLPAESVLLALASPEQYEETKMRIQACFNKTDFFTLVFGESSGIAAILNGRYR
jgi:hypothetical protein